MSPFSRISVLLAVTRGCVSILTSRSQLHCGERHRAGVRKELASLIMPLHEHVRLHPPAERCVYSSPLPPLLQSSFPPASRPPDAHCVSIICQIHEILLICFLSGYGFSKSDSKSVTFTHEVFHRGAPPTPPPLHTCLYIFIQLKKLFVVLSSLSRPAMCVFVLPVTCFLRVCSAHCSACVCSVRSSSILFSLSYIHVYGSGQFLSMYAVVSVPV